jgi:DNA mismatch endonuclease (patch repair protein)
VVFPSLRAVVFVDGDFWHGRILIERGIDDLRASFRNERRDFWIAKITQNFERDRQNDCDLAALGWNVIRVWERDILADVEGIAERVVKLLGGKVAS